ncbi:MAG: RNA polymerase sporulation sigma factor SigK [Coprobacillus cateniformis]|nr:RNA polymerase sporulation sigma factor SigK [Longibaculum muris]MBS5112490.1 RNA polymerase sporulation sigma factor SigK [Coprobacillus cateniformis]MBS5368272.1 RNA polymerase sporulation sigma factor SigK [Coprobacillus cateniformis]MCR1889277.1 RNA polymerase sporulation sigma factor SigK [Longibaculum muris]MED9812941.1 RNA polymerase sporulation sigma factor SigK [Longibaculum muris]
MLMTLIAFLQQFLFVSFIKTQAFKPQLTAKQESELLEKYFQGDQDARNQLIEHNLRLVAHIVKKYEGGKDLQEDLISIGTIGLIKAVDSYKSDKATKLGTYAAKCIENEILMHMRGNKKIALDVSLNEVLGVDKDGGEMTLLDILPTEQKEIIDQIQTNDQIRKLQEYFTLLTPREQEILIKRYGLNNHQVLTQKEIAANMHISRSYVSRLEKRALIKLLKAYLNDK